MHKLKIKILGLLVIKSLAFSSFAQEIYAEKLPQNPKVTFGKADFESSNNKLTINQNTNKLITNWSSFNIANGHEVEFKQPNAQSTALNRVQSNDPTYITGSLKANGNIILINPSGVLLLPALLPVP